MTVKKEADREAEEQGEGAKVQCVICKTAVFNLESESKRKKSQHLFPYSMYLLLD